MDENNENRVLEKKYRKHGPRSAASKLNRKQKYREKQIALFRQREKSQLEEIKCLKNELLEANQTNLRGGKKSNKWQTVARVRYKDLNRSPTRLFLL